MLFQSLDFLVCELEQHFENEFDSLHKARSRLGTVLNLRSNLYIKILKVHLHSLFIDE